MKKNVCTFYNHIKDIVFPMPFFSVICSVANGSSEGGSYPRGRSGSHSDKKRKKEEKARLKAEKVTYTTYYCAVKRHLEFHSNSFPALCFVLCIAGKEESPHSISDLL